MASIPGAVHLTFIAIFFRDPLSSGQGFDYYYGSSTLFVGITDPRLHGQRLSLREETEDFLECGGLPPLCSP
jgi:hypothetical protein